MAKELSSTRMATVMKANGKTVSALVTENIRIKTEPLMSETGEAISKQVKALKYGQKAPAMRALTTMERNKDLENTHGPMAHSTQAIGTTTKSTASASTCGRMAANTTASGRATICRATECMSMPMVYATRDSSWTTRRQAMATTTGQMAVNTRAGGTRVSSTASADSRIQRRAKSNLASGSKERD